MKMKLYLAILTVFLLSSCFNSNKTQSPENEMWENEQVLEETIAVGLDDNTQQWDEMMKEDWDNQWSEEKELLKEMVKDSEENNSWNEQSSNENEDKTIEELTKDFDDEINIEEILWEEIMNIEIE